MISGEKHLSLFINLFLFNDLLITGKEAGVFNSPMVNQGMFASIVLNSAIIVEGAIEHILEFSISQDTDYTKARFEDNVKDQFLTKIQGATGLGLIKSINERFNIKIEESASWKDIKNLFNFRDFIAHGNTFVYSFRIGNEVDGKWINEFEVVKKRDKALLSYLFAKKLLSEDYSTRYGEKEISILNFEIAKHFFSVSKYFLRELKDILPESETKTYLAGLITFLETLVHPSGSK